MTKSFDAFALPLPWQLDAARIPEVGYDLDDFGPGAANPIQRAADDLNRRRDLRARYRAAMGETVLPSAAVEGRACALAPGGCSGHIAPNARSGILRCDECWQES